MLNKFKVIVLFSCMLVLTGLLAGCSSPVEIGNKTDDAISFEVTNNTGQAITSVSVKGSWSESYAEPLKQDSDFKDKEKAVIYCEKSLEETVSDTPASADGTADVRLEPLADIQFATADGMTYEMHQIKLSDVKDAAFGIKDGTAYLSYTSLASGENVDMYEAELSYQEQQAAAEKAAAEQAAAEQAAAEQAAAEKAAAEKAAAEQTAANKTKKQSEDSSSSNQKSSGNSGTSSSQKSSGGSESSSSGSGSSGSSSGSASSGEDTCVDDLVLN